MSCDTEKNENLLKSTKREPVRIQQKQQQQQQQQKTLE